MKRIQVLVTFEVNNDQYSELLNFKQTGTTAMDLLHHALEHGDSRVRVSRPSLVITAASKDGIG